MSEPIISRMASGERRPVSSRYTCWDWSAAGHCRLGQPLERPRLSTGACGLTVAQLGSGSSARLPHSRPRAGANAAWTYGGALGTHPKLPASPIAPGRHRQLRPRPAARGGHAQPLATSATQARRLADAQSLPPLCTSARGCVHRGDIRTPPTPVWMEAGGSRASQCGAEREQRPTKYVCGQA